MATKQKKRHRQERFLFLLMGCILIGLLVVGYFLYSEHLTKITMETPKTATTTTATVDAATEKTMTAAELHEASFAPGEGQLVTLYFAAAGKDHLVKESRRVIADKMVLSQANILIRELLRGPFDGGSRAIFPEGTQLRSLFYTRGTFFVDFTSEVSENHPGGAIEEALTIFALVNTLTELDPRAKVQILVNGQEQETLKGHLGLDQPFSRYEDLLVGSAGG